MSNHMPGFQSSFSFLCHFVLAKLGSSSIRVNGSSVSLRVCFCSLIISGQIMTVHASWLYCTCQPTIIRRVLADRYKAGNVILGLFLLSVYISLCPHEDFFYSMSFMTLWLGSYDIIAISYLALLASLSTCAI